METGNDKVNLNKRKNKFNITYPVIDINSRTANDQRTNNEMYTDGSKMNDRVGSAIIVYKDMNRIHQEFYRINNEATVYMAQYKKRLSM